MNSNYPQGQLMPLLDYIEQSLPEGKGKLQHKKDLASAFGCCWHSLQYHLKKNKGHVFVSDDITVFLINGRKYQEAEENQSQDHSKEIESL